MQLLDRIVRYFSPAAVTAQPQKPGRHSEAGLLARVTAERDEARRRSDLHLSLLRQRDAELQQLKRLLGQDAQVPASQAPAPMDVDGSCFNEPDPQPLPDEPRAVPDTPAVAETYEPADPNAETQPVAQVAIAKATGMDDTVQMPAAVTPVTPVVIHSTPMPGTASAPLSAVQLAEPLRVTWGVSPKQREHLADWPLATAPPPGASATEVSAITGALASHKVRLVTSTAEEVHA